MKNKPKPKFVSSEDLSAEQLTDPDYRLKLLEKMYSASKHKITCSKCHHCR